MAVAKKVVSSLTTTILVLLLLLTLMLSITSRINNGIPKLFGYEMMTVLSGSMEPKIHTGSVVFVKPVDSSYQPKVGDIVTFKSPIFQGMLVTHRIHSVQGSGQFAEYITKGDANNSVDARPVPAHYIVAKYTNTTIPYVGYILSFIQSKLGIALLLIVPGAILMFFQIFSIFRAITKQMKAQVAQAVTSEQVQVQKQETTQSI